MQPLNKLVSPLKDNSTPHTSNDETQSAFNQIKDTLADATLLTHPKLEAPTCIMTDASDTAVGAVLQQYIGGHWHPITYFSKVLKPAERR